MTRIIETGSERETIEAGRVLGAELQPGDVVLLSGPLGAGKTAFVRGLAQGISADPDNVSSPTFTILQEYKGATTLQHADLYRLTPAEADDLGLEEFLQDGILAVEWPDRWRSAPEDAIHVSIAPGDGDARTITIYSTR